MAVRAERWHSPTALLNTLRHIGRYSGMSLPLAALLASPLLFVSLAQWGAFGRGRIDIRFIPVWISLLIIGLFTASVWLQASILKATESFAEGENPGIGKALTGGLSRSLKLVGTMVLIALLIIGAAVAGSLPLLGVVLIAAAGPGPVQFEGPLLVLVILAVVAGLAIFGFLAVIIFFRYALAQAAAVIESRSPSAALERSKELMRGRWLDFFLLSVMVWIVTLAIQIVVGTPAFLVSFGNSISRLDPGNPFSMFMNPPRIGFAAALITAISTYLVQVATPLVAFGARANFFLMITGEVPQPEPALAPGQDQAGAGAGSENDGDSGEHDDGAGKHEETGNLTKQKAGDQ